MTISSLTAILEQFNHDDELAIEVTKEGGGAIITYDIGFCLSESGEFMLQVHE